MGRLLSLLLPALLLAGCGTTWEEWADDAWAAECSRMEECGILSQLHWTLEECLGSRLGDTGGEAAACAAFDPARARSCLDQVESVTCEDYLLGRNMDDCEQVCGDPW